MVRLLRKLRNATWLLLSVLACTQAVPAESGVVASWGNAEYVDLAVGESFVFRDRRVTLVSTQANYCKIEVDDVDKKNFHQVCRTQLSCAGNDYWDDTYRHNYQLENISEINNE